MLRDVIDADSHPEELDGCHVHEVVADPTPTEVSEYLLVCEAFSTSLAEGHWRFSLESASGEAVMEAEDDECGDLNRLTLLAAIRGLEAIDGPASVTLLSNNRYLIRSLSDSLPRWRMNGFAWEQFGRRVDVQHADLWRRIDRALGIHRVEACLVSSRLVSNGKVEAAGQTVDAVSKDEMISRIDSPHPRRSPPRLAARRSDDALEGPKDRLRQWLLAGGVGTANLSQHRFTSEDLLRSHVG